jgi:hypothetical protein
MPELSRFLGAIITMYFNDHGRAHFHVRYGEHKARIDVETLGLISGYLPPRIRGAVVEWAAMHQQELADAWALLQSGQPARPIAPLE